MVYRLIYPSPTKLVTSRRWELVREGIEDYRILPALRNLPTAGEDAKLSEATRDQIKHLIKLSLSGMIDKSCEEMPRDLGLNVIDATKKRRDDRCVPP